MTRTSLPPLLGWQGATQRRWTPSFTSPSASFRHDKATGSSAVSRITCTSPYMPFQGTSRLIAAGRYTRCCTNTSRKRVLPDKLCHSLMTSAQDAVRIQPPGRRDIGSLLLVSGRLSPRGFPLALRRLELPEPQVVTRLMARQIQEPDIGQASSSSSDNTSQQHIRQRQPPG